ncbi:hypothetical protein HBH1_04477 [Herbaspirillum sp. BH-1]|jgi:hypothetical protein|uniref:Type IV pilus biogenesis protein PilP n=1 Tax=Herbaspirillum frisingense TaxID=92645 RepID=A0ABU1PG25_9BURK|nr:MULTISPECIES: hypothetical protein [Herbaspirillum]MDR6584073.1 hypothetical protein [Herbaspirillum frisingense]PLY57269.1 hypothetical protein HBH1_04477 [Herbaspirillum sp. BH-1]
MQKVKTSNLPLMITFIAMLLGVVLPSHATDAVAQTNESATRLDQSATLGDMIKLAKQAGEREFAARINPASKSPTKDAQAEPQVERSPVLLALYGIDRNYKAELDVNGQTRVVLVPGPLRKMGPWKYITLMEEGVLLTKSPQDRIKAGSTRNGTTVQACQQHETCLFLSVPKGSDDSRSQLTADSQARHLASQLPGGGRAAALEFGGKPQNPGDRINMGNTTPASR